MNFISFLLCMQHFIAIVLSLLFFLPSFSSGLEIYPFPPFLWFCFCTHITDFPLLLTRSYTVKRIQRGIQKLGFILQG